MAMAMAIDIVDRLSFDATCCEIQFSSGVAANIEEGIAEIKRLRTALRRIRSLGEKNVPKYAQQIASEAIAAHERSTPLEGK